MPRSDRRSFGRPFTRSSSAPLMLAVIVALVAMTGCISNRRGFVPGDVVVSREALLDEGYRVLWQQDLALPGGSRIDSAVVLGDVVVVLEQPGNIVSVFSMSDGRRRFTQTVGDPGDIAFEPVRSGGSLLVATETHVYEYNIDSGRLRARRPVAETPATPPSVFGESLVFGGVNGVAWAQSIASGQPEWRQQMVGKITARPLVIDNNRVFVADMAGNLATINANGRKEWAGRTHSAVVAQATPLGIGLYVPSTDFALYGLAISNGDDRWPAYRSPVPLTESAFAAGVNLYLPIPGLNLVALETTRGDVLWEHGSYAQPLVVDGDRLLIAEERRLVFLNADTGEELEELPTARLVAAHLTEERKLVAVSTTGNVLAVALD